ncbi:MAG TPA: hypothetical protein DHG49_04235 [Clostridiales bacterium]|jgi:hypothetical protein|nr:MAG: hypothetical protein DBY28_00525 [Subdoligranulum sp.]HCW81925.1 hypothetical protein [Clostridiales bacterium]
MTVFDIIISYNFSVVNGFKKIFIQPFFSFSVRAKKRRKKSVFVGLALEKQRENRRILQQTENAFQLRSILPKK